MFEDLVFSDWFITLVIAFVYKYNTHDVYNNGKVLCIPEAYSEPCKTSLQKIP